MAKKKKASKQASTLILEHVWLRTCTFGQSGEILPFAGNI